MKLRSVHIVLAACAALAQVAIAQSTTRPAGDYRSFTLTPAAPPVPALKYRFDVDPIDRVKGNAAVLYLQGVVMHGDAAKNDGLVTLQDQDFASDEEFARAAAEKVDWLDTSVPIMLQDAQRRTDCDWNIPLRDRGIEALLPYLNDMRAIANYLRDKHRLAVAKGDVDGAVEILRAMIQLGNRCDDGGGTFAVSTLVSVGIQAMAFERLEHMMNMANSPNYYWSLRSLPSEFGNQLGAAEAERETVFYMFPSMLRARSEELSAAEWQALLAQVRTRMDSYYTKFAKWQPATRPGRPADDRSRRVSDAAAIQANDRAILPAAREHYIQTRHVEASAADKIEPAKLVAILYYDTYLDIADESIRMFSLPYPERLAAAKLQAQRFDRLSDEQPSNPFFVLAEPLQRFVITNARCDRMTAGLCAVEAIRAYAARHNGQLPPTLDAVGDDTPPPTNPTTGKPFDYRVEGDTAILSDAGANIGNGEKIMSYPMEYVIRIRH